MPIHLPPTTLCRGITSLQPTRETSSNSDDDVQDTLHARVSKMVGVSETLIELTITVIFSSVLCNFNYLFTDIGLYVIQLTPHWGFSVADYIKYYAYF